MFSLTLQNDLHYAGPERGRVCLEKQWLLERQDTERSGEGG